MNKALVVYETLFGNTRMIARAIGDGLTEHGVVDVLDVRDAAPAIDGEVDVLVVGGPTHQLGMTRPASRREVFEQYPDAPQPAEVGLREWLGDLRAPAGCMAAAFDSRFARPWILRALGHANRSAQKALVKRGLQIIAPPAQFLVMDAIGPPAEGEIDRARNWGRELGHLAATPVRR
jgi:flavodoxin